MVLFWAIRFFVFKLYESPKFLMGRGRDAQAVEVVHHVAAYNGKYSTLSLEHLSAAGKLHEKFPTSQTKDFDTSVTAAIRRGLSKVNAENVRALFATRKLAYSTSLLIILWGAHLRIRGNNPH